MREIRFYRTPAGHSPAREFLESLTGRQVRKVAWVLRLVREMASVPGQYMKKLGDTEEIWEIRAQQGGDTFRLLGFFASPNVLVFTNGFAKKTAKTPKREIEVAEARRHDYLERRDRNG